MIDLVKENERLKEEIERLTKLLMDLRGQTEIFKCIEQRTEESVDYWRSNYLQLALTLVPAQETVHDGKYHQGLHYKVKQQMLYTGRNT